MSGHRGSTNSNDRGSSRDRAKRRLWLIRSWGDGVVTICFFCGRPETADTVSVDRIIPGILGGTYQRGNIRPACARCNSSDGTRVRRGREGGVSLVSRLRAAEHPAHVLRSGLRLLPGQDMTIRYLLGVRMPQDRIALEVGCSLASVRRRVARDG